MSAHSRPVIEGQVADVLAAVMEGMGADILHLERGGNGRITASMWSRGQTRPLARNVLVVPLGGASPLAEEAAAAGRRLRSVC